MVCDLRVPLETASPSLGESEVIFHADPAENSFVIELSWLSGFEKGMVGIDSDFNH